MSVYLLNIKDKFIESIRNGTKKHEYRLANEERQKIKIGDTLVLLSRSDPKNKYVKCRVTGINKFSSWEDAFNNYWEDDFKNIYLTIEEALNDVARFYKKEDVIKYGIFAFDIEPETIAFKRCNVLLDTNIVISRETSFGPDQYVIKLFNFFDKLNIGKYITELTKREIGKYENKNKDIENAVKSKINSYQIFSLCENTDEFFDSVVGRYGNKTNDKIDNLLLLQVFNGLVDFLITDDKCIQRKAKELFIGDRVYGSYEFLSKLEDEFPEIVDYEVLNIIKKPISEIDVNDSFFDSLREDYGGIKFNDWLKNKRQETCYAFYQNKLLKGFLYLKKEDKNEDYSNIAPAFSKKDRLKIGTFKIESTGLRVGERFLKIIFDNAKKFNVDEIYVTLFENKREEVKQLESLLISWGFFKYGLNSNGEAVLVKSLSKYNLNESPMKNYPLVKEDANIFILPLYPNFHTMLFPDLKLKSESDINFPDAACRYALEKYYICGNKIEKAKPGDIFIIYRIGDREPKKYRSVVTGTAIYEGIKTFSNFNDFKRECKNKSVFSSETLKRNFYSINYRSIIKLIYLDSYSNQICLNDLRKNGILEADQSLKLESEVPREKFDKLESLGKGK